MRSTWFKSAIAFLKSPSHDEQERDLDRLQWNWGYIARMTLV